MKRPHIPKKAITIDYSRDALFDELGLKRLKDGYMKKGEKSPQDRFAYVARVFASDAAHAQRLYDYISKHWFALSTPIQSFTLDEPKALPISCYLSYADDSADGLINAKEEAARLTMAGGGVGIGMGMRSEGGKSTGVIKHSKVFEAVQLAYKQGYTRRGAIAVWLDVDHPQVEQFMDLRLPTGDPTQRATHLHHGLNISDKFMDAVEASMYDADANDVWELFDPNLEYPRGEASVRGLWEKLLITRARSGEPMIHFIDASNRALNKWQKAKGLKVRQTNICTEIIEVTDKDRTAVCCISSPNLVYFDEWGDNHQFYEDIARFLDNALTLFIKRAPKTLHRAVFSAKSERSIGIGALGFHTYLQMRNIPFESAMATGVNLKIFNTMKKHLDKVNSDLGAELGSPPDLEGSGLRFANMMAIAPNATSSLIFGNVSPSIEPIATNGFRQDTLSGSHFQKNKILDKLLKERLAPPDYDYWWSHIIAHAGSVQLLPPEILSQWEKDVFKTAYEMDQRWLVAHAVDRQPNIDQAQSLNLFFRSNATKREIHEAHFRAWKGGLKSLYYMRTLKAYHGESVGLRAYKDVDINTTCLSCE